MASMNQELIAGTYRCPVCGHYDRAEVPSGQEHQVVTCSYCDTALEVWPRGADSVRFSVQVAEDSAPR